MRDTSCLRTRIALLACLPGLATAAACSSSSEPQPVDQGRARDSHAARDDAPERATQLVPPDGREKLLNTKNRLKLYEDKAKAEGKTLAEVAPPDELAALEQQKLRNQRESDALRLAAKARGEVPGARKVDPAPVQHEEVVAELPPAAIPGDPPFIDGYNPEEEHCLSGNWCGTGEAAAQVAIPQVPALMSCSTRIGGGKASALIEADPKAYAGLSNKPNMQGGLNEHGTELARARTGDDTMCCYHWFEYCSGRPHVGEHGPVHATGRAGDAWHEPASRAATTLDELPAELRARIAAEWLEDARAEHASVAAFARATLELMAVGAPPALLADAQRAALDEIDHAQRCFTLASHYGGSPVQPGPLPALGPRRSDLATLAADTFAEGCVGETIAALVVQRAARHAAEPSLTTSLERIADDEARHAALAWSTIAWALEHGGDAVAQRLRETAERLRPAARPAPARDPQAAPLAAHGRLDARGRQLAALEAWADVIDPMLASLLAASAGAEPVSTTAFA